MCNCYTVAPIYGWQAAIDGMMIQLSTHSCSYCGDLATTLAYATAATAVLYCSVPQWSSSIGQVMASGQWLYDVTPVKCHIRCDTPSPCKNVPAEADLLLSHTSGLVRTTHWALSSRNLVLQTLAKGIIGCALHCRSSDVAGHCCAHSWEQQAGWRLYHECGNDHQLLLQHQEVYV